LLETVPPSDPGERRARAIVARVIGLSEEERDALLTAAGRTSDPDGVRTLMALRRAQRLASEERLAGQLHLLVTAAWHGARAFLLDEPEKVADELGLLAARAAAAELLGDRLEETDRELLTGPWRAVFGD
jgi:hypothetical protein